MLYKYPPPAKYAYVQQALFLLAVIDTDFDSLENGELYTSTRNEQYQENNQLQLSSTPF